jgi:hypothetical protein
MCKLFGQSPGQYLGIVDQYLRCAVDLACAAAFWYDENQKYEESKKTAGEEASAISSEITRFQQQFSER